MAIYFPISFLIEEHAPAGAAALRINCGSVTVGPGGATADGAEVGRLVGLNWTPRWFSFESGGETLRFEVQGVAVIRPARAVFPFV